MNLDVQTLLIVMMINMIALSVAMPAIMGWRVSRAARCAQGSVVLQTLGWSALVLSGQFFDRPLSILAMAGLAAGQALLWESMRGWLGPRPGRALVWGVALLMPLGYGLGFPNYPFRVGWANAGLALQMAWVCVALAWPAPQASRRWRLLIGLCLAAMAVATAWRGVLGAFFTDSYPTFRAPHPVNVAAMLIGNLSLLLTAVGMLVAWREEAERALQLQARTDSLTGLLNRRALQLSAADLLAQARRHRDPMALLLIDLDHFKQINDRHGHERGDRALQLMSRLLQSALRRGDLAGRWGGEEFCVLLARADADAAIAFDQRLRERLARHSLAELGFGLDFSTGLATLQRDDSQLASLLHRADAALYAAKDAGRGRMLTTAAVPVAERRPAPPRVPDPTH
ncbi:MAG: GGDEF domain-containing protein [Burkholderiaceae bacterium]|nr:GGDEF domain-containing protein [Burkholderiaceae bacterium]